MNMDSRHHRKMSKGDFHKVDSSTNFLLLQKNSSRQTCGNCLRLFGNCDDDKASFIRCDCGDIFCRRDCAPHAMRELGWHSILCSNRSEPMLEFYEYCRRSSESFTFAAKVLAQFLSAMSECETSVSKIQLSWSEQFDPRHKWSELAARANWECTDFYEFVRRACILEHQIADAWDLLKAHLNNRFDLETKTRFAELLDFEMYADIVASIQRFAVAIGTEKTTIPPTRQSPSQNGDTHPALAHYGSKFDIHPKVSYHCAIMNKWPDYCGFLLAPILTKFQHSCNPSVQVEANSTLSQVKYGYIALREIDQMEPISLTTIPLHSSVSARDASLLRQLGKVCVCSRCSWEREDFGRVSPEQMKQLALQAQEEGRYSEAELLFHCTLLHNPHDTDVLHAYGVTLLSQGKWKLAHSIWQLAFKVDKAHLWLSKQFNKDVSYAAYLCRKCPEYYVSFQTISIDEIYLTTNSAISPSACSSWIKTAEAHATNRGGWDTDRHKSVATTDLPIHEIPSVLREWNLIFGQIIGPFIQERFRVDGDTNLRVHDAFIVKYDASDGQCQLPVHTDQGHFSITLSLNDPIQYKGGGTIFPEHEFIVRPKCGDFVAFRSYLTHGGVPITSGVRYIVVAFLYLS